MVSSEFVLSILWGGLSFSIAGVLGAILNRTSILSNLSAGLLLGVLFYVMHYFGTVQITPYVESRVEKLFSNSTYGKSVLENAKEVASDTFQKVTNSLTKGAGDILSNTASLAGNAASVAVPLLAAYQAYKWMDPNFVNHIREYLPTSQDMADAKLHHADAKHDLDWVHSEIQKAEAQKIGFMFNEKGKKVMTFD